MIFIAIEDESKFYIKNDFNLGSIIKELRMRTGLPGDYVEITDTYFRLEGFPKNSTLRIRDYNDYTMEKIPTLKMPIKKNQKRIELETLDEISTQLGMRLYEINDIYANFEKDLTIKQKRFILEYDGVEFAVDDVKYEDNLGNIYHSLLMLEAELKGSGGDITRRGIIDILKKNKLLGKSCKPNKYEIGLKKLKKK